MATLNPYVHFPGTCVEAMKFYQSVLGGKLDIMKIGDSPMAAQMPDMKDQVLHSNLQNEHITLMASDMGPKDLKEQMVELTLVCSSKEEIESLFKGLSEGGKVTRALTEEFFGTFAQFTDKFGVQWMMQFAKNQQK